MRAWSASTSRARCCAARARGAAATALVQADATALPLRDATLDALVCGFALRNFAELEPVLREMARVLAPGGRLALLEVDRPASRWLRAGHSLYFDRVVPALGGWLSDRAAYAYLPRSTSYLPDEGELLAQVERAGFARVRKRRFALGAAQLVSAVRGGASA